MSSTPRPPYLLHPRGGDRSHLGGEVEQRRREGGDLAERPGPLVDAEERLVVPGLCLVDIILVATLEKRVQSILAADG